MINGEDVDFTDYAGATVERKAFYSPLGDIAESDLASDIEINTTGNVTANYFMGDGTLLTNISTHDSDRIVSSNGQSLSIGNDSLTYSMDSIRMWFSDAFTIFSSPTINSTIYLWNSTFSYVLNGVSMIGANSNLAYLKSPDGIQNISVNNSGAYYNGVEIVTGTGGLTDRIVSNDGDSLIITDTGMIYNDGVADRLQVSNIKTRLYGEDGIKFFQISEGSMRFHDGGGWRQVVNDNEYSIRSPNRDHEIAITDADIRLIFDNSNRIKIDGSYTNIYSPNGDNLKIGNDGLFYGTATVQTSAHKGVANGLAELDASGKVPLLQLPGFVDEIIEYDNLTILESTDPQEVDKIYLAIDTGVMYRYSGTPGSYAEVSSSIALGTTSATAYRGDRGLVAYDHSQSSHEYEPINENIVKSILGVLPELDGSNLTNIKLLSSDEVNSIIVNDTAGYYNSIEIATINDIYTDSDIDGNENAFSGWDKDSSDDFDGTWDSLSGIPSGFADGIDNESSGGSSNALTSNDGLKYLNLTDAFLKYFDGTINRAELTAVHTKFFSPDGSYTLLDDNQYVYNDGTRNRLEINTNGAMLVSPNGAETLIVGDTGLLYNMVEIATVDDIYTHPTGDGNLHVPVNGVNNDGKVLTATSTAGVYTWQTSAEGDKITSLDGLNILNLSNNGLFYYQDNSQMLTIDGTGFLATSPDGNNAIGITNAGVFANGELILTASDLPVDRIVSPNGLNNVTTNNSGTYVNGYFTIGDDLIYNRDNLYTILQSPGKNHNLVVGNDAVTVDGGQVFTASNTLSQISDVTPYSSDGNILVWNATSSMWENRTLGSGGDVVGPSSSVDNRVVRWDGTTGKLIQDNGAVLISDSGDVLGVTSLEVDSLFLDLNQISTPTNNDLWLTTTGTGDLNFDGVIINPTQDISEVNSLAVGNLSIYRSNIDAIGTNVDIDLSPTGTGKVEINSKLNINDHLYFTSDNGKNIQSYYKKDGTRVGWAGYGSSGTNTWSLRNEFVDGDIGFHPRNANGVGIITNDAFTKLGEYAPAIKYKKLTGTMGATEGASVTIAHGLTGAKILDISVMVASSSNYAMPSKFTTNVGFQFEYYAHGTHLVIINHASGSEYVMGKPFRALITYEA